MSEIKNAFDQANQSGDGFLKKAEFGTFLNQMNESARARQLKYRNEISQEYIDMLWNGFNGYNQEQEGVSYKDLLYVLWQSGM